MVTLKLTYNTDNGEYEIGGNVKQDKVEEILTEFLRTQIGAGKDTREPTHQSVYHIEIDLDVSDDTFTCNSDCGNDSLRDGILLDVLGRV